MGVSVIINFMNEYLQENFLPTFNELIENVRWVYYVKCELCHRIILQQELDEGELPWHPHQGNQRRCRNEGTIATEPQSVRLSASVFDLCNNDPDQLRGAVYTQLEINSGIKFSLSNSRRIRFHP